MISDQSGRTTARFVVIAEIHQTYVIHGKVMFRQSRIYRSVIYEEQMPSTSGAPSLNRSKDGSDQRFSRKDSYLFIDRSLMLSILTFLSTRFHLLLIDHARSFYLFLSNDTLRQQVPKWGKCIFFGTTVRVEELASSQQPITLFHVWSEPNKPQKQQEAF